MTSEPCWKAAAEHRLVLQYDPVANRWQFYPRPVSLYGALHVLEWRESAGRGALVAHTVCHSPARGFESEVPYIVGIVRLDEGPRIFARIVNADAAALKGGRRMRLAWGNSGAKRLPCLFEPEA